jgi:imidazolonepropionase-like amidohydrolase
MKRTAIAAALLVCVGSCLPSYTPARARAPSEEPVLALVGAKIYPAPELEPILGGIVLVKGGKIIAVGDAKRVKIPENVRTLDCGGLTLVAAFWNSHVHFTEPKWENAGSAPSAQLAEQIRQMLTRYGFAHVLDTGSFLDNTLAIKRRIESGAVPGPSVRTAGTPFVPSGGSPFYIAPVQLPELRGPEQATVSVRQQIASGADAIKVFAASPASPDRPPVVLPLEIAKAVVSAAHALGKPVVAHPTTNAGVSVALDSRIDILAHTAPDGLEPWSEDLARRLRSSGMALVPTLKLWKWELERKGRSPEIAERFVGTALQQVRAFSEAGGEILFGTDVGYMTDYDPTDEYILLGKAGLTFRQILAALTTIPARRFGVAQRTGRVAEGMDADIVALGGDPAIDLRAYSDVRFTIRKGMVIYEAEKPGVFALVY